MMAQRRFRSSNAVFILLCLYGLWCVANHFAFAGDVEARGPAAALDKTCVAKRYDPAVSGGVAYFQDCADSPQLISFRGGTFLMGDQLASGLSYEVPVHEVHVKPFSLGRYEVTVAQWQACVSARACETLLLKEPAAHSNYPVNKVTWNQAQDYVKWLTRRTGRIYRLPSEAEWEYAARSGSPNQ